MKFTIAIGFLLSWLLLHDVKTSWLLLKINE